jgi:hypothetical protein
MLVYRVRNYNVSEWKNVEQRVPLTWTKCHLGGWRPWFQCPIRSKGTNCGRRVAKLLKYALGDLQPNVPGSPCGTMEARDPRATHRQPKRPYKTRIRMPSKLDPHVATIEEWFEAEPQLTALAIVCRLSGRHPEQFGTKQHSMVQRLLKTLRRKAAEKLIAQEPPCPAMTTSPPRGAVDGSGYAWSDPPTAPPVEQALEVGSLDGSLHTGSSAPTTPPG